MYMMNNFLCRLGVIAAARIDTYPFDLLAAGGDIDLELFLFSQYMPGHFQLISKYGACQTPYVSPGGMTFIEAPPVVLMDVDTSGIITATSHPVALGEVAKGTTVTAAVSVFGTSFEATLTDLNVTDGAAAGIPNEPLCYVQAPGATVRSPVQVEAGNATAGTPEAYTQYLLRETDYTEAMATADNVYTYVAGPVSVTARIVGLWRQVAP